MNKKLLAVLAAALLVGAVLYFTFGYFADNKINGADNGAASAEGSAAERKSLPAQEKADINKADTAQNADLDDNNNLIKEFDFGANMCFPDEDFLLDLTKKYTADVKAGNFNEAETAQSLISIKNKLESIKPETVNGPVYAYKYPCRAMAEQLYKTGSAHKYLSKAEYNFYYGDGGKWNVEKKVSLWGFRGYENAVYKAYFEPNDPKKALWGLECFISCREKNVQMACELECEWLGCSLDSLLTENEGPLEAFRQMFMYSSYKNRIKRAEFIFSVFPKDFKLKGAAWCELGYGTGAIFNFVRDRIGPEGKIYGVERDLSCLKFAEDLKKTGVSGWGNISFIKDKYDSCNMPPNSVDIFSEDGIHIGEARDAKIWDKFLQSLKKALKPGGLVVSIDNSEARYLELNNTMKRNGFELAFEKKEKSGGEIVRFVCTFRVKKNKK